MVSPQQPPRVRFAPSPSGYLHIGGARTALFNWLWARKTGGSFIIRVEDTDQDRSSVESVRAILDALKWLGMDWDEGPEVGGPHEPYFQSDRRARYQELAEQLIAAGKAYRCYATKEELEAARSEHNAKHPKDPFVYPGWWRDRTDRPDLPYVVRFKAPREGVTTFQDQVFGEVSTPNSVQHDFVLLRSDGFPLYNFSAAIDDHEMGITLVARGRDHIGNTPQQIMIYEAFGWEPPTFAHLPMMLAPSGEKLSKRHASVAVQDYAARGYTPDAVINYLARFGWSFGDQEIFSRQELIEHFDWSHCGRSDGKFDERKFLDVSFEHLKRPDLTGDDAYVAGARAFLAKAGFPDADETVIRAAMKGTRERARTFEELAMHLDYYFREPVTFEEAAVKKFLTAEAAPHLAKLAELMEAAPSFTAAPLEEAFRQWLDAEGLKMKVVAQPARVAVTGRAASPPLFDVMEVLGRERTVARLRAAAAMAGQA